MEQAVCLHLSIENQCYWVFDIACREDHNQTSTGNAAKNLATVRRIALNILNDDLGIVKNLSRERFKASVNITSRERLFLV